MATKKKSKAIELGHTPPKGSNTGSPGGNAPVVPTVRAKPGRGVTIHPDYEGSNFQGKSTPPVRLVRHMNREARKGRGLGARDYMDKYRKKK